MITFVDCKCWIAFIDCDNMVLGRYTKKGRSAAPNGPKAGSSSSRHVHRVYSSLSMFGLNATKREILTPLGLQKRQDQERQAHKTRMDTMPSAERAELEAICSGNLEEQQENDQSENIISIDDILSGDAHIDISHAGGKLTALADDLLGPSSQ
jgi:hypothetical protein